MINQTTQERVRYTDEVCLGLTLASREVGLALTTTENLVTYKVVNLRKIASDQGKINRFREVIDELIRVYPITRIAWCRADERSTNPNDLVARQLEIIGDVAREYGLARNGLLRARVLEHSVPGGPRTLDGLATALARSFEELQPYTQEARAVPGSALVPELALIGHRTRSHSSRYWSRMFLALGAAQTALHDRRNSLSYYPSYAQS